MPKLRADPLPADRGLAGRRPRSRASLLAGLLLLAGCSAPGVFAWADKGASADRRVGRIEAGPCGDVAPVRIKNMTELASIPGLHTDQAFEVDAAGKVRSKWITPANSYPVAIRGARLLVDGQGLFWIGADGSVRKAKRVDLPAPRAAPQCRIPAGLRRSDYAVCRSFTDLESGAQRQIAFEGPCT